MSTYITPPLAFSAVLTYPLAVRENKVSIRCFHALVIQMHTGGIYLNWETSALVARWPNSARHSKQSKGKQ